MKRKNLILGAVAATLAITGAFASSMVVYNRVKMSPPATPPPGYAVNQCAPISVECGPVGSSICTVLITKQSNGQTYGPFPVYSDAVCTNAALKVGAAPVTTTIP